MRVAVILLACTAYLASAQISDIKGQFSPIPIRTTRYQRPSSPRPGSPPQSVFANQRIRRPISFRPRVPGNEDGLGIGAGPFPISRPIRPNIPLPPNPGGVEQVKPVNEEVDDDDRGRDISRENFSEQDDTDEEEDVSEENIGRPSPPSGSFGPGSGNSRSPSNLGGPLSAQQQPIPIQYRPLQGSPLPTSRGNIQVPQPSPPPPIQYRPPPPPKPSKPRKPVIEEPIVRQQYSKPAIVKPVKPSQAYEVRGKKPVAQIIRRYRNDNEDGSITWGFENDDGSYKEEIIGGDCITRGKYGYVDPDGLRREYTYETGIKCDEEQQEDEENGFVDYQENKLVLPDGKTIDLSSMGKKQARRPRPSY